MDKWGCSYLIELKTSWEKEKGERTNCLLRAISPFPTMFSKGACLLPMRQNEYLWSEELKSGLSGFGCIGV